jgi:phosphatidylglycerol:prolipoprotein diacylglycerol transferase
MQLSIYSCFMLLAIAIFAVMRWKLPDTQSIRNLPRSQRLAILVAGFCGGTLGAKLPFALGLIEGASVGWFSDGKTVTTGIVGAYIAVELVKLLMNIRVKTGDSFALPLALAMVVGRLGCFFGGCCYGTESSMIWAVDFGDGIRRHPTQLYESLFHLAMAAGLVYATVYRLLPRQRLKLYLICYAIFRFVTEYIRPAGVWWLGLTWYQWVVLATAMALAIQWSIESRPQENGDRAIV